jgi:hypothetical protein
MRTGSAVSYRAFSRTWWRRNPSWPNGREPGAGPKTTLARHLTEDEARRVCADYNATHNPGPLSRKAEYERE